MSRKAVDEPFFSIIIPVYNASLYLNDCIKSIMQQSFPYWEAIFIDDGSTDNSVSIIRRAMSDSRIRLKCCNSNRGPSYARNRGLDLARSPWIVLLDADDWMADSRLSNFQSLIMTHPQYHLFADQYAFVADEAFWIFPNLYNLPKEIYIDDFIQHNLGSLQPVINRFFLLNNSISYDETISFSEDFDLVIKIFLAGARFYLDRIYNYYRRARDNSLSRTTEDHYSIVRNLAREYITMTDDRRIRKILKIRIASSRLEQIKNEFLHRRYRISVIQYILTPRCIALLVITIVKKFIFGNRYKHLRPIKELLPIKRGKD